MNKITKKIIIGLTTISILAIVPTIAYEKEEKSHVKEDHSTIAFFTQNADGNYVAGNSNTFPKEGYVLNPAKSTCNNGSELSQDEITRSIKVSSSTTDQCTLYFDKTLTVIYKDGFNGNIFEDITYETSFLSPTLNTPDMDMTNLSDQYTFNGWNQGEVDTSSSVAKLVITAAWTSKATEVPDIDVPDAPDL